MKLIGLDVGYGFVKVTDGSVGYSFPSIIGDSSSTESKSFDFKRETSKVNDLKIEYDNKLYYIGESATKHSNYLYRDLSLSRSYGNDFELLFFAALSLFYSEFDNQFKVVTGLPPERMHLADEIIELVRGEHAFSVFEKGHSKQIKINVTDIEVIPQPFGTFWNEYSQDIEEGKELGLNKIGVVDIGFGTTDFVAIEEQEYIPEKSITIPIGMSNAYKEISNIIFAQYGVMRQSHQLDEIILKKKLRKSGISYDISDILDSCFAKTAQNIVVEINSNWSTDEFDKIIFTGGGSHLLAKFMIPEFPQGMKSEDPFTANCKGYLSWAKYLWG